MKNIRQNFFFGLLSFLLLASLMPPAFAESGTASITSRFATVDGTKLHYLTAGQGPAVILLHGYTQTSHMWEPLIPKLAEKFTVIAPDLPGIGNSDIPSSGLDMKSASSDNSRSGKILGNQ